jgi:acetyl esterase/lipase
MEHSESHPPCISRNIVFGMYSGLALLLDIHHPAHVNGYAMVVVPGSGWTSKQTYDAAPLTALASSVRFFLPKLLDAGYTLFVVNHRNGPRFRYPAAVEDVQRAVRFVRFHGGEYAIDPQRIGALGYSSGAYLAALLGVLDTAEDADDPDPIERVSGRVQAVIAAATPADLTGYQTPEWALFMGQLMTLGARGPDPMGVKAYRAASPVTHVTASAAPMLLVHGDGDALVPFAMAETMRDAMEKAGVGVKLIRLRGGGHDFAGETDRRPDWPDFLGESVRWMDRYLRV